MEKDKAFAILKEVGSNHKTNLQGHQNIQAALQVAYDCMFPQPEEKKEEEVSDKKD